MFRRLPLLSLLLILAVFNVRTWAQDENANQGQADLDKALEQKLVATNLRELNQAMELAESAIAKGLGDDDKKFAEDLVKSVLLERAALLSEAILGKRGPDSRWPQLRQAALADLVRVTGMEKDLPTAQLLIGRLNLLPGGDEAAGREALNQVIASERAEPPTVAEALTSRATIQKDDADRLADLSKALEVMPEKVEAVRARGLFYLMKEKFDLAIADLEAAVKLEPEEGATHEALGAAYALAKRPQDALRSFNKAIEIDPDSPTPLTQRARLRALDGKNDEALADLDEALKLDPASLGILLLRARVHYQAKQPEKALGDVDQALRLRPDFVPALRLRAELLAGSGKIGEAIADLKRLTESQPANTELLLQLAMYHVANRQPRKGIELFTSVIESDKDNWLALRGRADAYLSVAKQAEAIADYEAALVLQPEQSGLLNNLAWVLATSPEDKLRDGKRAIELATKASEITKGKEGHILSTLAAAYAESGDFASAREWSAKAVALGDESQQAQLKAELASYEKEKPWRETQNTEENTATAPDDESTPAQTADF